MTAEHKPTISPRAQAALTELQGIITQHYPDATFAVRRGIDDPEELELWATVDVEDTDLVLDHVIDRVMELQLEEGLPLHVIPVRPRERALAMLRQKRCHDGRYHGTPP